jgi:hypothetical protein
MITNKVMNAAFANTYFAITWKTQRVEHVLCRTNVLAAISHYRTDFWKFLKSIVLRPCHMDTNLAMSHYWGSRTTESTPGFVYRFGLESVDDDIFSLLITMSMTKVWSLNVTPRAWVSLTFIITILQQNPFPKK